MGRCSQGILVFLCIYAAAVAAAQDSRTPLYSADGITNAASFEQGRLAPYSIGTIFGENLSNIVREAAEADTTGGMLPSSLPGADVHVYQDGVPVGLFYVSPTQINFLVRATLLPGRSRIRVARGVVSGPNVEVQIAEAAPAFFQLSEDFVVATHADGSVILPENPAKPGETVVLWMTGLGRTYETWSDRGLAQQASQLLLLSQVDILLDGVTIGPWLIKYAGTTPGFAGLYQVNVELPDDVGEDPEIILRVAGMSSRRELRLPAREIPPGAF